MNVKDVMNSIVAELCLYKPIISKPRSLTHSFISFIEIKVFLCFPVDLEHLVVSLRQWNISPL